MEEQPSTVSLEKIFSRTIQQLRTSENVGQFQQMRWPKANKRIKSTNRQSLSSCYNSLEMPTPAMEFLCRSWSPSATDILQTFSLNNQVPVPDGKNLGLAAEGAEGMEDTNADRGDRGDADEIGCETKNHIAASSRVALADTTRSKLVAVRSMSNTLQTCTSQQVHNKISLKHMKEFLKGKSLTSILRQRKEKKKEQIRLMTAKMHATLSVVRLAAAIAGSVSPEQAKNMDDPEMMAWNTNMGNIVAYAAALVASACAESAESTGAGKAHVASAINSGLAARSPADMMTVIATAATCLRGAATLKSRTVPNLHAPKMKDFKLEARLSVMTPSGQRVDRYVIIQSKHGLLRLSLEKKYLGILVTTSEYTIQNVRAEKRSSGCYLLSIKCKGGEVKLLFKDEQQSLVWMSNISNVLSFEHNSMT